MLMHHQPEVRRVLHAERVARLAGDARGPSVRARLLPPRARRRAGLSVLVRAAGGARHRLPSRT